MAPQPPKPDGPDWVESIVRLAAGLGFNPVRVRWRLLRMQDRLTKLRESAQRRVEYSCWQHKVCGRETVNARANELVRTSTLYLWWD